MTIRTFIVNAMQRSLASILPGGVMLGGGVKQNFYQDFGYPEYLEFQHFYSMYRRNPVAASGVKLKAGKTWETVPWLLEQQKEARTAKGKREGETGLEREIRRRFDELRLWQRLKMADERSLVGRYSGVILRLADGLPFDQPVTTVPGGLQGLVEVIPAWEGQLSIGQLDQDTGSETYGQPLSYTFNETAVDAKNLQGRSFTVHPDRVIIWSETGDTFGTSMLEAAYNAAYDCDKVRGSGAEGFWKGAKDGMILETPADDEGDLIGDMAQAAGLTVAELKENLGEQVEAFQKGFDDALLMGGGLKASTLKPSLPDPENFHGIALSHAAAAFQIPVKILVGMQTGERASTEDAAAFAATCQGRRDTETMPNLMALINRLERFGILPERDWFLDWDKLTESGSDEKIDRADKMAGINEKSVKAGGVLVFLEDEMREEAGHEPNETRAGFDADDENDALGAD